MDTLITTVVAERVRPLSAALPLAACEARPTLAPCPDHLSMPGVRVQGVMGDVAGPRSGWPFGAVDTDADMGSYFATRDHDHTTYNSIKFGNRQGPPCSPPV